MRRVNREGLRDDGPDPWQHHEPWSLHRCLVWCLDRWHYWLG